jgi:nitrate reductase NapAB chaperone NapD
LAIAGALVVPVDREQELKLQTILDRIKGVEVQKIGPKGLAVVLEAASTRELKKMSEEINNLDEVVDFSLGYLNWEDQAETPDKDK